MPNMMIYAVIFFLKVLEVALMTLRMVLITKNERLLGAVLGFFEVILWVFLVSQVLSDLAKDPFQIIIYALAFAVGNYVGSYLENKLAIGNVSIEAIVSKTDGQELTDALRENNIGVTTVDAKGMTDSREILLINTRRKYASHTIKLIRSFEQNSVITLKNVTPIYGGYNSFRK
ncbi:MAG: DUF5698 domain-containing protein [Candidatus Izimaplasma sp.]|nr:DUF5698 domain-containing protein [Candidatus Izimaplasma bacterium]